jgi:two-component system, chemotaxis family, sensor kinase CheA
MSSQEFLQDYIEEVQEHLMDMEKSLLILEQEGADQEQIAQVFRAAHSIKGASTYMGFEGLAAITHELESLIAEIQQNSGSVPSNGISILLQCVDLISVAVEHVKKEGVEPPLDLSILENLRKAFSAGEAIPDLQGENDPLDRHGANTETPEDIGEALFLEDADFLEDNADIAETPLLPPEQLDSLPFIQEEDEELLAIFVSAIRENYANLHERLQSSDEPFLGEDEHQAARELIQRMISSAQYMDYQPIVEYLSELEASLINEPDGNGPDRLKVLELLETTGSRLEQMVPGLGISAPVYSDCRCAEPDTEEDEELFAIFLSTFQQNFAGLAGTISSPGPAELRLRRASELTGSLLRSSQYMDYEQVVELLKGWEESLAIFRELKEGDPGNLRELFLILAKELQAKLPGLLIPDLPENLPGDLSFDSLEDEMDLAFDMAARPLEAESLIVDPDLHGATVDESLEPFNDEEKGIAIAPKQPEQKPPVQSTPSKDPGKTAKERTVLVAEDVSHTVTLRVDAQKVDQLLNQVGELVVSRSEFVQTTTLFRDILRDLSTQGVLPKHELRRLRLLNFRLNESTQSLGRVANDLQASVMRVRMLPILQLFQRFPRIVRDQALKLGKKVELMIEGGETEIDKRVLEQMNDPLVQFLRNAIVHGLESPDERKRAGKPETGTVRLAAYHSGDYVTIEVEDDGRGVDTQKLRDLLRSRNEISRHEVDKLSDQEIAYSMFMPGISTYDRVDGAAGRGVGLDVVKENVEHMNGSIEVETYPGQGTRFIIRIPLTVAIIRALLVKEAGQIFTVPLTSVTEILRYRPEATHSIEGFRVVTLRGKTIPLVDLRRLLKMDVNTSENARRFVVIVSTSFREVGLVVDSLIGEREVVIKSIENGFHAIEGFSGATILGDGRVSLIVDVSALLRLMKNSPAITRQTTETTLH